MSTLTASLTTGTQVKIATETHEWLADEPLTKGGTDIGPNPYDLLLGSLAACTCITMSLYAQHKGIELDSVTVSFEFDRVQAEDCEECDEDDKGLMERIRSDIKIKGNFDEAQKKRLTQIASRCPVHKTLAQGVVFGDNVSFE